MTSPLPTTAAEAIESAQVLDAPAKKIGKLVRDVIPDGTVKDALSGTWVGHALHPLLTDVPIGTWTSATLLDVFGGRDSEKAARRLVGAGLLATVPTVVTGWNDWADSEVPDPGVRRLGLVHAAFNGAAAALMTASWAARGGAPGRGKLLGFAGVGLLAAGGWLGGHLSYAQGVGVDQTAFDEDLDQWAATGVRESDLVEGRARCVQADGVPVMLVRDGGQLRALHNRCAHRGGPLDEGEIAAGTVTCPWHRSVLRLEDGSVQRGPTAYPQPVYDVRIVTDGEVEVRLAER